MDLPSDLVELLAEFDAQKVEYLLVGGLALALHGHPRFTKDADLWVRDTPENLERVENALRAFGAPRVTWESLRTADPLDVVWMGQPPSRIDLMKAVLLARLGEPGAAIVGCRADLRGRSRRAAPAEARERTPTGPGRRREARRVGGKPFGGQPGPRASTLPRAKYSRFTTASTLSKSRSSRRPRVSTLARTRSSRSLRVSTLPKTRSPRSPGA